MMGPQRLQYPAGSPARDAFLHLNSLKFCHSYFLLRRHTGACKPLFSHLLGDLRRDHASDAQHIDFYSIVKLEDSLKAWKILEVVLGENPVARECSSLNGNMLLSKVDKKFLRYKDNGKMNLFITTYKMNLTECVLAPGLNRVITFWRSNTFGRGAEEKKKASVWRPNSVTVVW